MMCGIKIQIQAQVSGVLSLSWLHMKHRDKPWKLLQAMLHLTVIFMMMMSMGEIG